MRCGLLGQKLSHSYSPAIHSEFGEYSYDLFEVEPQDLAEFFNNGNFGGINVTIPYKQDVMKFCNELSPSAQEIGSVNTILRKPSGELFGDNTDAAGFRKMTEALGVPVKGKKVVIFGSGGSSLSVRYVMKSLGAGEIVVITIEENTPETLKRHENAAILVNCTPVGMYPHVNASPCSLDYFPHLEGVLDLVYNPARTRLMTAARSRGIPAVGGLIMLVGQAAVASEIFTGGTASISKEKIASVVSKLRRDMENIILVGMPGSGKSTHGRILSERLGKKFVDTDTEIEKAASCTIPEIFANEGEAGFRTKETAIMEKFGKESGLVIATGGGVVTRAENYEHLHQNGVIIFTERAIDELPREGRPLSQGDLTKMYEIRLPMYQHFADITVHVDGSPEQVSAKILEVLEREIYNN
ncbi:MAG: shikimate kinase [Defluviitaleaceae bacterium]|nr:shikimate kinase [Defluviitaleaceae bacterium]